MLVTDAQVHMWDVPSAEHPWPAGRLEPHRPNGFTAEQCLAEVAHPDHHHRPAVVGAEDVAHGVDQLVAAVADSRVAELAEIGQVFTDLSVG